MGGPTLHDFISDHRGELFALAAEKIKDHSPELKVQEVGAGLNQILDEIVGALERADGLPASSPLPELSPTAKDLARERQHRGYSINKIALDIGSISDAIGSLGGRYGLSFTAREYWIFNSCIDNAVSSALDTFWNEAMHQYEHDATTRLGFLAHELRNALAGAKTAFSVLRRGQLGITSRTGDILGRSLGRLENLINQTLLTVQLHAGVKPELRRMRVADLLREVEETAVPERGIHLKVEVEGELEVEADERLLISACGNLVQNAFKFTRAGGEIVLRGRQEGAFVVLEVEDQCGGLPPGRADELFQPYVQKGNDRRGLGLGLAITREAVEAHGGSLSVKNLPGKGCVFSVKLLAPGTSAEQLRH